MKRFGDSYTYLYRCVFCDKEVESYKKHNPEDTGNPPRCPICTVKRTISNTKSVVYRRVKNTPAKDDKYAY